MGPESRRRRLPRSVTILLAIVVGLLIGIGLDVARSGGPGPWLASYGLPPPYLPQGERIDIGDRTLYLDCRGEGLPTIVLEAGSGADSGTWSAVHDTLAERNRTCAYDRAGRGQSDTRAPHTLGDAATDLHALLEAAGERGPFVLVGHSLGGAYARVFASAHRDDVVGVVLVDAFNPDLLDDWIHPLLGSLRPGYEAQLDGLRAHVSRVDLLDWPPSEAELRAAPIAGLPLEVLVAPRHEPRLDAETNERIAAAWIDAFESLSPGRLHHTVAWGAGHNIHIERPDLVIDAVGHVVEGWSPG